MKSKLPSIIIVIILVMGINAQPVEKSSKKIAKKHSETANIVQKVEEIVNQPLTTEKVEEVEEIVEEPIQEEIPQYNVETSQKIQENNNEMENIVESSEDSNNEIQSIVDTSYTTRMTSYYPEESSDCTGSGLCSWDFQTNEFGWYTYQGKLVVATATEYLLKYGFTLYDGVHTYRYYDEITLNIDGVDYQAIVLDSCGSSMKTDRIDLFVSGSWAVKDTMIEVKE